MILVYTQSSFLVKKKSQSAFQCYEDNEDNGRTLKQQHTITIIQAITLLNEYTAFSCCYPPHSSMNTWVECILLFLFHLECHFNILQKKFMFTTMLVDQWHFHNLHRLLSCCCMAASSPVALNDRIKLCFFQLMHHGSLTFYCPNHQNVYGLMICSGVTLTLFTELLS